MVELLIKNCCVNKKAVHKSLPSIDREYTFSELTIAIRAGQAKALGLKSKGHSGVGADADIAIYNIDPQTVDPSRKYKLVRKASNIRPTPLKTGRLLLRMEKL